MAVRRQTMPILVARRVHNCTYTYASQITQSIRPGVHSSAVEARSPRNRRDRSVVIDCGTKEAATALPPAPLASLGLKMQSAATAAPQAGLSDREAASRLEHDGYNELPSAKPRNLLAIAAEVVREPMFLLLIASGGVYLLLGDPEEAMALLVAVFLVIGITLYQVEHVGPLQLPVRSSW
jgi:hypothetical protein